ncbi:MAG: preprotein translocase subunit SecA, partial [Chloroflexi bacterium]|nr:preprotein translocase subunit SecA [Chloroflexota bacterium]
MAFNPLRKIIGDPNERALKQLQPIVDEINDLERSIEPLSDDALTAKTEEFRARLEDGETLDDLLPEALAVCREAIRRTVGERAYDVQLTGAIALHRGMIAEMRTGEGKTLVATLALYANALSAEGAPLVTVNDSLARREPQWYGPALDMLGMRMGVIQNGGAAYLYSREPVSDQSSMEHLIEAPRRAAYEADITYGTNNEFGFDYLRDNMVQTEAERVQGRRHFAIVDEADSVLIDEARTPLVISGRQAEDLSLYPRFRA